LDSPTSFAEDAASQQRMRPLVTAQNQSKPKVRPTRRPPLPEAHADVSLGDINDLRALTRMSASWIHDAVRAGNFPRPVIQAPRCTRWRIADVRAWLMERIAASGDQK